MQEQEIIFSVIMPTFNSEETIGKALRSIRKQDFQQNQIEIMVIDGGSTDNTINIAKKFGAIVLRNERKFPEYAKQIGIKNARGKYIILQDSDEVLTSKNQYANRLKLFEKNPHVTCVLANRLIPGKNCGICCSYLNTLGDPFTYFIYKYKGSIVKNNTKYLNKKTKYGNIYHYQLTDIFPIGDGGATTINLDKAKERWGEAVYEQEFAASAFMKMIAEFEYAGCSEKDNIVHYSYTTLRGFLKKLRFKIVQNLNDDACAGFANREKYSRKLQIRKKLFILYAASMIVPIIDAIRLSIVHRDITFILHFVYTYYIVITALCETLKKICGIRTKGIQYGK